MTIARRRGSYTPGRTFGAFEPDGRLVGTTTSYPSTTAVLDSALRSSNTKVFAAHLGGRVDSNEVAALRLGKKAEAAYERAGELTRLLDRYAYYVDVRFDESDVDQARAAGVVVSMSSGLAPTLPIWGKVKVMICPA